MSGSNDRYQYPMDFYGHHSIGLNLCQRKMYEQKAGVIQVRQKTWRGPPRKALSSSLLSFGRFNRKNDRVMVAKVWWAPMQGEPQPWFSYLYITLLVSSG